MRLSRGFLFSILLILSIPIIALSKSIIENNGKEIKNASLIEKQNLSLLNESSQLDSRIKACVKSPFREKIENVSLIEVIPSGKRSAYHIAVKVSASGAEEYYGNAIVVFINGNCSVPYANLGQDSPPLHYVFNKEYSRLIAISWYKWRIKNIQGEKHRLQEWLNKPLLKIPEEDYFALSQLGFKLPKKYQLVP